MKVLSGVKRKAAWRRAATIYCFAVLFGAAPHGRAALAQPPIEVLLNGRPLNFGDTAPTQQQGRVLVPLRGVFEALGAQVNFDGPTQTILANRAGTQIQLQLGSR